MRPAYAPLQPFDPAATVPVVTEIDAATEAMPSRTVVPIDHGRNRPGFTLRPVWRGRIVLTLNQLTVMTQNGIEIAEALESVADNCRDAKLAATLRAIHAAVNGGQSLSAAVAMHGIYFPPTLAPMLAAAEASGEVPGTLGRVCLRMREELKMRGTIFGAMIYPAILIGASSIVMCALILGVLPQFSRVFDSMGKTVPIYTRILLSFGDFCREHWILILLGTIATMIAGVILRRHAIVRTPISRFLMYGPLIRDAYRPLQAGRVLRTIAAMVHGGVPLLQAVQFSRGTTSDRYWRWLLDRVEENLIDGSTASSAMNNVDFIPPETAQLMATAERTGRVAEVLEDIGVFYEEEAERRIKRLVVAIEPVIIIVMGVIVAGIVMSVMLPLLDVSTIG